MGTMLLFPMHRQMRNSLESRNLNSTSMSHSGAVLAKAKQKQNSNNKNIGWPFQGQAVRTVGEDIDCCCWKHCFLEGGGGLPVHHVFTSPSVLSWDDNREGYGATHLTFT